LKSIPKSSFDSSLDDSCVLFSCVDVSSTFTSGALVSSTGAEAGSATVVFSTPVLLASKNVTD
jgi:hypothetical protein